MEYSRKYKKVMPKSESDMMPGPSKKEWYPHLCLPSKDIPEAKNWKIGDTKEIALKIKLTSIRESEMGGDACFDIVGIAV